MLINGRPCRTEVAKVNRKLHGLHQCTNKVSNMDILRYQDHCIFLRSPAGQFPRSKLVKSWLALDLFNESGIVHRLIVRYTVCQRVSLSCSLSMTIVAMRKWYVLLHADVNVTDAVFRNSVTILRIDWSSQSRLKIFEAILVVALTPLQILRCHTVALNDNFRLHPPDELQIFAPYLWEIFPRIFPRKISTACFRYMVASSTLRSSVNHLWSIVCIRTHLTFDYMIIDKVQRPVSTHSRSSNMLPLIVQPKPYRRAPPCFKVFGFVWSVKRQAPPRLVEHAFRAEAPLAVPLIHKRRL